MRRRQLLLSALAALPDTVDTAAGKVRGSTANGVTVFRGVPYAAQSRFEPPRPATPWPGIRDCTQTAPRCPQGAGNILLSPTIGEYFRGSAGGAGHAAQPESEDCLGLNILTPSTRGRRPVLAYIHGGGFSAGSSHIVTYATRFPREQDVVLVGINHRINAFGYLPVDTPNLGQLDLVAALAWLRDNIANFGGDPANVTIFGESGGAGKISALLGMPAARGLFRRAILESGSLLELPTLDEARARLPRAANLRALPADQLRQAAAGFNFRPVVDGRSIPAQLWSGPPPVDVPLIIGCCKDETSLFTLKEEALYSLTESALAQKLPAPVLAAYRRAYPRATPSDIWFRYATDSELRAKAIRQAELQLRHNRAPVWMYHFVWNTPLVDGKIRAFHTAELPLALRLVRFPESEPVSRELAASWTAFARRGHPGWPAYTTAKRATRLFDSPRSSTVDNPDGEILSLLRSPR